MPNKHSISEINNIYKETFKELSEKVLASDKFDPSLYDKYNVKRGLRNQDGTGVLVGLTSIGDVRAYIMDEKEKVPIDGKFIYRGINVKKLVEGVQRRDAFGFEETAYLLLMGSLPNDKELADFNKMLGQCFLNDLHE